MPYISRADWGAAHPKRSLPVSSDLRGVCLHWMGFNVTGDPATVTRSIQRTHMSPPRSWWDLAYNEMVALDGTVLEGRSFAHRSGRRPARWSPS